MNKVITLGASVLGGLVGLQIFSPERRRRVAAGVRRQMRQRMEQMMASLPEESPPKLIMTVLPQLHEQNEQIIAMLREQNALLRDRLANTQ